MIPRLVVRLLLATLFGFAGTYHLIHPVFFLPIMPPFIPHPIGCVVVSGVFELLGALGLLVLQRDVQWFVGWMLVALLVAVFPANVYMAWAHIQIHGFPAHNWEAWARLPLQPLLIAGVIWVTGCLQPMRSR